MRAQRIRFTGQVDVPLVGDGENATPVAFEGARSGFQRSIENLGGVNTEFLIVEATELELPGTTDQG